MLPPLHHQSPECSKQHLARSCKDAECSRGEEAAETVLNWWEVSLSGDPPVDPVGTMGGVAAATNDITALKITDHSHRGSGLETDVRQAELVVELYTAGSSGCWEKTDLC